jgi:hypothetical protein
MEANTTLYETPGSSLAPVVLVCWWCDLEFLSEESGNYGYVGRSVAYLLGSTLEDILAEGAQ